MSDIVGHACPLGMSCLGRVMVKAGLLLALGTGGGLGPSLAAQQPAPPAGARSTTPSLVGITTDTGDFAPGRNTFERYQTPTFCLAAAQHAQAVLRRALAAQVAADSLRRTDPLHDTLPAGVATVARSCSRHLVVATTATAELPAFFDLALLAQDDVLGQAVLVRRLALAPSDSARFDLERQAVEVYLAAEPAQLAAAERVVAQLEAQGAPARVARAAAHAALAQFGLQLFDSARVRREAAQVFALARAVPAAALAPYWSALETAYRAVLTLAFFTAPDSLLPIAQRAQQDLGRVPSHWGTALAHRPLAAVLASLCPVTEWQQHPRPPRPLTADVWLPAAAKDTTYPVPGRVSLVIYVDAGCDGGYVWGSGVLDPMATGCYRIYQALKRWHQQYGGAGLDITLVTAVAPGLNGTVLNGPQSLAQAAATLQQYFLEELKLPVQRLAVQAVPVSPPLPAPDGRRFAGLVPYRTAPDGGGSGLGAGGIGSIALIDRSGLLVYAADVSFLMQATSPFEQLLRRLVTGPPLALPAAGAARAGAAPASR